MEIETLEIRTLFLFLRTLGPPAQPLFIIIIIIIIIILTVSCEKIPHKKKKQIMRKNK
jgi:hypothetical protein